MFVRNGQKLGSVLVDKSASSGLGPPQVLHRLQGQEDDEAGVLSVEEIRAMEEQEVDRADGVHSVGGGWHEVVIDGEVIDKIRGADAAQEAYEAYQQSEPGEE